MNNWTHFWNKVIVRNSECFEVFDRSLAKPVVCCLRALNQQVEHTRSSPEWKRIITSFLIADAVALWTQAKWISNGFQCTFENCLVQPQCYRVCICSTRSQNTPAIPWDQPLTKEKGQQEPEILTQDATRKNNICRGNIANRRQWRAFSRAG